MGQYIGFNLGREEFVIPILMLQEIMKPTQPTQVPNSSPYIKGVISLRGKTIALLDLKGRLGFGSDYSENTGKIIVINMGRITFGAFVDAITGVMDIKDDMIKSDLVVVGGNVDECIKGIVHLTETRIVMVLDFKKLLSEEDLAMLEDGLDDITDTEEMSDGRVVVTKRVQTMGGEFFVKEIKENFAKKTSERGVDQDQINDMMELVQQLLDAFAEGNIAGAEEAIEKLSSYGEKEIFSEVGKMTRKLHDSLSDFKSLIDPRLKNLAEDDVPDAADKLMWVIDKTDEAASKSISIAEKNQSRISQINLTIELIEDMFPKKEGEPDAGREALDIIKSAITEIDKDMIDIMLAQEYQDLTGQIIKKVVKLVSQLEDDLVNLVKVFGVKVETPKQSIENKMSDIEKGVLSGPQIKGGDNVLSGQGDVDALLSDFGF